MLVHATDRSVDTANTLAGLELMEATVPARTPSAAVARVFKMDSTLPGVLVVDGSEQPKMLSRQRFLQQLSRPFGVDLFLKRPVSEALDTHDAEYLQLPGQCAIEEAVRRALCRSGEHLYDPVVVELDGANLRLLDMHVLLLAQSDLLARANAEVEEQKTRAEEASAAKSQFLANVSHELRTPLNAVIGYSEYLTEEAEKRGDEHFTTRLKRITTAGRHLLGLINDLLDVSKIEAGKVEVIIEEFELGPILAELQSTIQPMLDQNQDTLVLDYDGSNLGSMHSDVVKLRQVLLNVLSNACKFTQDGTIRLRARRIDGPEGACIAITVADTGIGMTPNALSRIFESFTQADASTTRKYGGTGLGLAISRQLCRLLGGDITAESLLGQGSTFSIVLPVRTKVKVEYAEDIDH